VTLLKQGFISIESTPANEIRLEESYKKTLSKCCIALLRPPPLPGAGFCF
jgi:hypothetical protein